MSGPKKARRVVVRGDGSAAEKHSRVRSLNPKQRREYAAQQLADKLAADYELVISAGHKEAEVLSWTPRKLDTVASLVNDRKSIEIRNTAVAMRMAFGADKIPWREFLLGTDDELDG